MDNPGYWTRGLPPVVGGAEWNENLRKMQMPPSQRSTYGPTGLDHSYIAKKAMGEEGFRQAQEMGKDPTLLADFPLYSVHLPVEMHNHQDALSKALGWDDGPDHATVMLKRIGETISWKEFEVLFHGEDRTWMSRLDTNALKIQVDDAYVERVENAILTHPIEDPFTGDDMMEEL